MSYPETRVSPRAVRLGESWLRVCQDDGAFRGELSRLYANRLYPVSATKGYWFNFGEAFTFSTDGGLQVRMPMERPTSYLEVVFYDTNKLVIRGGSRDGEWLHPRFASPETGVGVDAVVGRWQLSRDALICTEGECNDDLKRLVAQAVEDILAIAWR